MALTLENALKFGGLFGSTVIAGARGIGKPVENISVLEIADSSISKWVEKNQLYITSFYAIRNDIQQQKVVIKALYENGGCGLILCNVGMLLQSIDDEVIDYCDKVGFPLIQARADVSYIEIMTPIINELFVSNSIKPAMNSDDDSGFLDIIINEEKTENVLREFNRKLSRRISYYDIYGRLVFGEEDSEETQWELEYLNENFNHILYLCSRRGYAVIESRGKNKLFALIRSQRNLFGVLITDHMGTEDPEETLLKKLTIPCALLLGRRDRVADYQEREKEEFITDLITGNFASEEIAQQRAGEIGFSRESVDRLVIVNINTLHRMSDKKRQSDIQLYIKNTLMPRIIRFMKSFGSKNWCVSRSDIILVFVSSNELKITMDVFCDKLMEIFRTGSLSLSVSIGISRMIDSPVNIPDAYSEAYKAAILGRESYGPEQIIFYDQVWFFSQILDMSRNKEAKEARYWLLRPLEDYDNEHGTNLVYTLKRLIYNSGNVQKTAKELYIHKNTMLQRKNRIIGLLGYSPFEMPHLLNLLMALEIKDAEDTKTDEWYKDGLIK